MFLKICREYKKLSREELRELLCRECEVILPALAALNGDGKSEFFSFVLFACSDWIVPRREDVSLLSEVSGIEISYEDARNSLEKSRSRTGRAAIESTVDTFTLLDGEAKASLISFCIGFCAANGTVTLRERRILKKLMK